MRIKRTMTTYKNRIKIEMKRLHIDYNVDPFTIDGKVFLRSLKSERIDSYLRVLNAMEDEVRNIDRDLMKYQDIEEIKLLQTIPGIGLFSAFMIYSEIGDTRRFTSSSKLLSYAGAMPSVRQSSNIIKYGRITRQGSKNPRLIITECLHIHLRFDPSSSLSIFYRRISMGKKRKVKASIAASNKLLKIIYWVLKERRPYVSSSTDQPR